MSGKAGRGADQFVVRLPDGMRTRIRAAAEKNGRSMNAEIVDALLERFPDPEHLSFNHIIELLEQQVREEAEATGEDPLELAFKRFVSISQAAADADPELTKRLKDEIKKK